MKIKTILPIVLLGSVFLSSAFASPKPSRCPPVENILSLGISHYLLEDGLGLWHAMHPYDHYDGDYPLWGLLLDNIPGATMEEGYKNGVASLNRLVYKFGPIDTGLYGIWLCSYTTGDGIFANLATKPFEK